MPKAQAATSKSDAKQVAKTSIPAKETPPSKGKGVVKEVVQTSYAKPTNGNVPNRRKRSWKKAHPLEELLGFTVRNSAGETCSPKDFAGEDGVIGLYFSARWCPPCRTFTPKLARLHDELRKAEKKFEVIFISFDYNEVSYNEYLAKMPWYAIDFADTDKKEQISEKFGIKGIPVLLFINAHTTELITMNGREIVALDPTGKLFPWSPQALPAESLSSKNLVSQPSAASVAGSEVGSTAEKKRLSEPQSEPHSRRESIKSQRHSEGGNNAMSFSSSSRKGSNEKDDTRVTGEISESA